MGQLALAHQALCLVLFLLVSVNVECSIVAIGCKQYCVLENDADIFCFGSSVDYLSTVTGHAIAFAPDGRMLTSLFPSPRRIVGLEAGCMFTCAQSDGGEVVCWDWMPSPRRFAREWKPPCNSSFIVEDFYRCTPDTGACYGSLEAAVSSLKYEVLGECGKFADRIATTTSVAETASLAPSVTLSAAPSNVSSGDGSSTLATASATVSTSTSAVTATTSSSAASSDTTTASSTYSTSASTSITATCSMISTPSTSISASDTASATVTASITASNTDSVSSSPISSINPSGAGTSMPSGSSSKSPSATKTVTLTNTPSSSITSSSVSTTTPSGTVTATAPQSGTSTSTGSCSSSVSRSVTSSLTISNTFTPTVTGTSTPSNTRISTSTSTLSSTTAPTATGSITSTPTSTVSVTNSATKTLTLSGTASITPVGVISSSKTMSISFSSTKSGSSTPAGSITGTVTSTVTQSVTASQSPLSASRTASITLSATRSIQPTALMLSVNASLAVGVDHSCVLFYTGKILCWGKGESYRLGTLTTTDITQPYISSMLDLNATFASIALGDSHTCVLSQGGVVKCFGKYAQTTFPEVTAPYAEPMLLLYPVVSITSGFAHMCALLVTGDIQCAGANLHGSLGIGSTSQIFFPVQITPLRGDRVIQVTAGKAHTCVLMQNYTVRCFGGNFYGQLGYNHTTDITSASNAATVPLGASIQRVIAGYHRTCAIFAQNGSVKCWGDNTARAIGFCSVTTAYLPSPADLDFVATDVKDMALGANHTCALYNIGDVRCWGEGAKGALGYGTTTSIFCPYIAFVVATNIVQVKAGSTFTCILDGDGNVACFGSGEKGQLGFGTQQFLASPDDHLAFASIFEVA